MAKEYTFVESLSHLPKSKIQALGSGELYYFTGKKCKKGHLSERYSSSGNCVKCIEEKRNVVFERNKGTSSKRSIENQKLAEEAFRKGETKYKSTSPCPKGHYLKFTTSNNCAECCIDAQKRRKESSRWSRIKKIYGISKYQFNKMKKDQNNECSICKKSLNEKNTHIDHCHKSGNVRSLLCGRCNQAIGLFLEDENILKSAMRYIRKHSDGA